MQKAMGMTRYDFHLVMENIPETLDRNGAIEFEALLDRNRIHIVYLQINSFSSASKVYQLKTPGVHSIG